jgi:hypothetical protein
MSASPFALAVEAKLRRLDAVVAVRTVSGRTQVEFRTTRRTISRVAAQQAVEGVFPTAQIHEVSSGPGEWPAESVAKVLFSLPPEASL